MKTLKLINTTQSIINESITFHVHVSDLPLCVILILINWRTTGHLCFFDYLVFMYWWELWYISGNSCRVMWGRDLDTYVRTIVFVFFDGWRVGVVWWEWFNVLVLQLEWLIFTKTCIIGCLLSNRLLILTLVLNMVYFISHISLLVKECISTRKHIWDFLRTIDLALFITKRYPLITLWAVN